MGASSWYLESRLDNRGRIRRAAVRPLPFRIGRRPESDLFLSSRHGSGLHAEIFEHHHELWVRDLGSTNGTSVNGERLTAARPLTSGDVLHFADCEFRAVELPPDASLQTTEALSLLERERLEDQVKAPGEFREMLRTRSMRTDFQPVVRLADGAVHGYEMLGRGRLGGIDTYPAELFYIAERLGDEVALSQALRARGLELAAGLAPIAPQGRPRLFMNTHPKELSEPATLLDSLAGLRREHPDADLVLELHEAAATELSSLRALRAGLEELDVAVAFDDFGTGRARLLELTEISPHYLKFDAAWVEDLDLASARRREMVSSLLRMVRDLEITPIAECVESAAEAEACRSLGFQLAQGHYLGAPTSAEKLLASLETRV